MGFMYLGLRGNGMGIKIKPADSAFSKCIRERVNYVCESCGKQYDRSSMGLHCSHFFSRRHRTIRWCSDNAASHCFSCHHTLGGNPIDFTHWIERYLGQVRLDILIEKRNDLSVKISKLEEKEIAKHYRKELKLLKEKRANGETGIIEFVSYQ